MCNTDGSAARPITRFFAGAGLRSERVTGNTFAIHSSIAAPSALTRVARILAATTVAAGITLLAGCGNQYRPVVSSINPVGPAAQPEKFAVVISSPLSPTVPTMGTSGPGLVTIADFAGDTILDTTALGTDPQYLMLDVGGATAYVINGDSTLNSFSGFASLIASSVNLSTVPAGATPTSIYPQGTELYITQPGLSTVGQYTTTRGVPAINSELPTGTGKPVYTVGSPNGTRAYALVQNGPAAAGYVSAIETGTNTISAQIPVGINPVYGVMSVDTSQSTPPARRAFILNNGSNTVSVINAQTNAPDTFTASSAGPSTIQVGVAPVWADLVPTRNEVVVANAGNGTTPGSVTVISIPLCSQATIASNPNCDPANPVDAAGFGTVLATIPVGINPVVIAALADGSQAYVANAGNIAAGIPGSVSVINLLTNTVIATLPGSNSTNPNDTLIHGHPNFLAVSNGTPTGKVYVTAGDSTDLTIIRTDIDTVQSHLGLQGYGVMVRTSAP